MIYLNCLITEAQTTWEVNTTNLEKSLTDLPPARNFSIRVRAYNDRGLSPPTSPVFCVTQDGSKFYLSLTVNIHFINTLLDKLSILNVIYYFQSEAQFLSLKYI